MSKKKNGKDTKIQKAGEPPKKEDLNTRIQAAPEQQSRELPPDKKYLVTFILAVLSIGILAFAIAKSGNGAGNDNAALTAPAGGIVIDNSVIFQDLPPIPDAAAYNTLSSSDLEKAEHDHTMIRLAADDGSCVYVKNFKDRDYFAAQTSYEEAEVEKAIFDEILIHFGEESPSTHKTAELWDTVSINYIGRIGTEAFEGGTGSDAIMLGSGSYIPGFEEGVVGMKPGETRDIALTFPENYDPKMAGKDAVFTVTLDEILTTTKFPELSDEIVQQYSSELSTVQECRDYFAGVVLKEKIWDFLAADFYVEKLSEDIVINYYNATMNYYDRISQNHQETVEEMISGAGETLEEFKSEVMRDAAANSRYSAFYQAVMKELQLSVSEDSVSTLANLYGYSDIDSFYKDYGKQSIFDYLSQTQILDALAAELQPPK